MVKRLGPRTAIVSLKELGTNCWHPRRFVEEGSRCEHLYTCKCPERKNCQAVHAEIAYLKEHQRQLIKQSGDVDVKVEELIKMLEK